jgi:hypothetical protein
LQLIAFVVDGEPGRAVALSTRRVVTSGGLAFRCSRGLTGFSGGHFVESFNIGGSHFYQYCSVKRICFANETEM